MEKPDKQLTVWSEVMKLVPMVYELSHELPTYELYSVTRQIHGVAVSIPGYIAEGAARNTNKEFIQFLHISLVSLSELDTLIELARRLRSFTLEAWVKVDRQMIQIDKMVTGLIKTLHLNKTRS